MILPIAIPRRNESNITVTSTEQITNLSGFRDQEPKRSDFLRAVIDGLSTSPKTLPSKYFYDEIGSDLFDEICQLDEYYPTRTEQLILDHHKQEISDLTGENCHLAEFGSGSSLKVRTLMQAFKTPLGYVPIDISRDHLIQSAQSFSTSFPNIPVTAICADYTSSFDLPPISNGCYLGFYPGSTIGNFTPFDAITFLRHVKTKLVGGGLLIGVDLIKPHHILNAAYDDANGVTRAFNKNILARCNRELLAEFELSTFDHRAFYNDQQNRVEMHLVSNRDQLVRVKDHVFSFAKGESIHTENSYKYTVESFQTLAKSAGFTPVQVWTDPDHLFSVHYLSARAA